MTDLASPAPAAPEPVAAPVSEAPVAAPEPSSAPEPAPVEKSPRASLERAFAKMDTPEGEPAPKAETPVSDGPVRGPDGRFAPKAETPAQPDAAPQAPQPDAAKSPLSEPPARFSPDAKAAWAQAPEAVRGEVHRAVRELERGLQTYQAQLAPLKPYLEQAQKAGGTLEGTLAGVQRIDQACRSNLAQGLDMLARTYGASLEQVARHVLGQPAQAQQAAKDQQIVALQRELAQMRGQVGQVTQTIQQQRQQAVMDQVARFAEANPHLDDLAPQIAGILRQNPGTSLQDAYQQALDHAKSLAARLIPAPPMPTAPQPRPSLSVTGAPSAGSNPARPAPSKSPREALERALRATGS